MPECPRRCSGAPPATRRVGTRDRQGSPSSLVSVSSSETEEAQQRQRRGLSRVADDDDEEAEDEATAHGHRRASVHHGDPFAATVSASRRSSATDAVAARRSGGRQRGAVDGDRGPARGGGGGADRRRGSSGSRGASPSPEAVRGDAAAERWVTAVLEVVERSRGDGGCGGALRYRDLPLVGAAWGLRWSQEECDDLWYDIQKGLSATYAVNLYGAARCIAAVVAASRARHRSDGRVPFGGGSHHEDGGVAPFGSPPRARDRPSPSPPVLSRRAFERIRSPTASSVRRRSATPRGGARDAPGAGRRRSGGCSPRAAPDGPPTATRAPSAATAAATAPPAVFHRLQIDVAARRERRGGGGGGGGAPPTEPPAGCTFRPAIRPYQPRAGSAAAPRAGREEGVRFNKPTKSYYAKLLPHRDKSRKSIDAEWTTPSSARYLYRRAAPGAAADADRDSSASADLRSPPTAVVKWQPPAGASAEVPPGYVEAVARLRRYAAQRQSKEYIDTLRPSQHRHISAFTASLSGAGATGATPHGAGHHAGVCARAAAAELEVLAATASGGTRDAQKLLALWREVEQYRKPILRLPVSSPEAAAASGPTAKQHTVDVRLARPQEVEHLARRALPPDDPRRVLLERALRRVVPTTSPTSRGRCAGGRTQSCH